MVQGTNVPGNEWSRERMFLIPLEDSDASGVLEVGGGVLEVIGVKTGLHTKSLYNHVKVRCV